MNTTPPPYTPDQPGPPAAPVTPKLTVTLAADPTTHDVLISLVPPPDLLAKAENGQCNRAPVDICCVIDVSGSMGSELKASLEEGKVAELTGLSTLDVVKHAVRTIVATMEPDDRISVVTFSDSAKVMVWPTPMTAAGKEEVLQVVQSFHTMSSTNLWEGLKTGMNVLNGLELSPASSVASPISSPRLSTLFLLTDGMPNLNPPRGIIKMLRSYLDAHPLTFSIYSFGFGYTLDSQLLLQIARLGRGIYGFIPDASALGAVFIHAVANIYSMCADQVELNVEYSADGSVAEVEFYDGQDFTSCSRPAKLEVGALQYGQTRDFVFRMKNYPQSAGSLSDVVLSATVRYRPWTHSSGDKPLVCTASLNREAISNGASEEDHVKLKHHSQRFMFIRAVDDLFRSGTTPLPAAGTGRTSKRGGTFSGFVQTAIPKFKSIVSSHPTPSLSTQASASSGTEAGPKFNSILTSLQTPPLSVHAPASALAEDIKGEVILALSSDETYSRWGQHYLPSLARWHLLQQCGSYRDPGLQVYGAESPLFVKSRDALDQAFDSLPPPEPSRPHRGAANQQPIGSMSTAFAARSGPCFDGACRIALADGQTVLLRDLRRGVRVQTPKGDKEVVAVLETRMQRGEALLCELPSGLRITPWHPIKVFSSTSERWAFPVDQASPALRPCEAVYSLLLEPDADPDAHGVYVQDVLCVTLGHGITHSRGNVSDVRAHEFLGDYKGIVQSLTSFSDAGVDAGVFRVGGVVKHGVSGTICGFVPYDDRSDASIVTGTTVPNVQNMVAAA